MPRHVVEYVWVRLNGQMELCSLEGHQANGKVIVRQLVRRRGEMLVVDPAQVEAKVSRKEGGGAHVDPAVPEDHVEPSLPA